MWARSAVTSPRGLILTRQVHFFRDVMMIPLFTYVVGGNGYSPRLPHVRPDRVRCACSFFDGRDIFEVAVNRSRPCPLTFTSHSFPFRAAPAPSSSLRSSPLPSSPQAPSFPPLNSPCHGAQEEGSDWRHSDVQRCGCEGQESCGCRCFYCHRQPEEG